MTICVGKESFSYFTNYCGYKCAIICGVYDIFRDLGAKLPITVVQEGVSVMFDSQKVFCQSLILKVHLLCHYKIF